MRRTRTSRAAYRATYPLQNGTLETKVARSSDRPVSCILFIGLASLSFPKRSRNRQCPRLLFDTRARLGFALQSLQFDDKETTIDPITAMREARIAVVGRHARHLLSNCAPALNLDYHCIRRLHARIALTDSLGVQARLHPAVQRRLVLVVHRFRALSARRSRRACRQAQCVHSEADARARTHCPRGSLR